MRTADGGVLPLFESHDLLEAQDWASAFFTAEGLDARIHDNEADPIDLEDGQESEDDYETEGSDDRNE